MTAVLNPNEWLHRILGQLRLLHGHCPRCNSDAPHVDDCRVCEDVHIVTNASSVPRARGTYPPTLRTKALWWYRWFQLEHLE